MTLTDLQPAIARIAATPKILDIRGITYLSTYPSILSLGKTPGGVSQDRFNQIALMAYGWMPRVIRIDQAHMPSALKALNAAQSATPATIHTVNIQHIEACLHSVVGVSKVLHFINDAVFPIWDSGIEAFRLNHSPPHNHMNLDNYRKYVDDIHSIRTNGAFGSFFSQFNVAMNARLSALGIAHYPISPVRAIEAAAFELTV